MVMESHESWERVNEGLSRAASCCRELAVMTNVKDWTELSKQFILMRKKAKFMYDSAPLSEVQVMAIVSEIELAQKAAALMRAHG